MRAFLFLGLFLGFFLACALCRALCGCAHASFNTAEVRRWAATDYNCPESKVELGRGEIDPQGIEAVYPVHACGQIGTYRCHPRRSDRPAASPLTLVCAPDRPPSPRHSDDPAPPEGDSALGDWLADLFGRAVGAAVGAALHDEPAVVPAAAPSVLGHRRR
jgi:hypothetical protein